MNFFRSRLGKSSSKAPNLVQQYNKYLIVPEKRPSCLYRLFCFPCAGGNANIFNSNWSSSLPHSIEYVAVQYPGRQTRSDEPFLTDMKTLVSEIVDALVPYIQQPNKPYAFFGHSLGTIIAYETALEIRNRNFPLPLQLFVAGRGAPGTPDPIPKALDCDAPDNQFIDICLELFGPSIGLLDRRLHSVTLPPLRADLKLYYSYKPNLSEDNLGVPIVAFGATGDKLSQFTTIQTWKLFAPASDKPQPKASNATPSPVHSSSSLSSSSSSFSAYDDYTFSPHPDPDYVSSSSSSPSIGPSIATTSCRVSSPPFQAEMIDAAEHQFLDEWRFKESLSHHLSHLVLDLMPDEIWC